MEGVLLPQGGDLPPKLSTTSSSKKVGEFQLQPAPSWGIGELQVIDIPCQEPGGDCAEENTREQCLHFSLLSCPRP